MQQSSTQLGTGAAHARPLGVTILALLAVPIGVIGVVGALAGMVINGPVDGLVLYVLVVGLAMSVLYLAFALGAWTLRPWAWLLGVVIGVATIVTMVIQLSQSWTNLISDLPILQPLSLVMIAASAVGLVYLFRSDVKARFGRV